MRWPTRSPARWQLALGEQQERLIEALLTLASSQRGIGQWEPFDLAHLIGHVLEQRHQDAERRGIQIDAALSSPRNR